MEQRKKIPLLVLSVSSLVSSVGFSSWVVSDFNEKKDPIKISPSLPVCYIQSSPNIKYTSIEKALSVAGSNDTADTIVVIPGVNPIISESCTISEKDTLLIPYEAENCNRDLKSADASTLESGVFSDDSSASISKNKKSEVTIKSADSQNKHIVLNNKGKIVIGGELGLGTSKQRPSGHTNGRYSQITLQDDSLISNSGTIECYGYIKGTSAESSALIINESGSSFFQPFVIDDYKGGSFSSAGNSQKVFPFNIFELPNCQITNEFYYGSSLNVWLAIYANNTTYVPDSSKLVGTSGALFNINSGKATIKYNSSSFPNTKVDIGSGTSASNINKMKITIEGNVSLDSMELSLGNTSLSTGNFAAPISYKFDVEVCDKANLLFEKKTKFLSGSSLTIDKGAAVSFDAESIFYQDFIDDSTYVSGQYSKKLGPAKLLNNGTLNLNSKFGGFVETNSVSGKIVTGASFSESVMTQELISAESGGMKWTYEEITGKAFGLITENDSNPVKACFGTNSTYSSKGNFWNGNKGSSEISEQKSGTKSGSCILPCSKILMSDGSYKYAGDIKTGDIVISFNHETGRLEPNVVIGNDDIDKPANAYNVVHLEFSDGQSTDFVYEHGYFDATMNRYVYLHEDDAQSFVGHDFICVSFSFAVTKTKLIKVTIREEITKLASPATANHLNFISDHMLSIGGGLAGLFNIFEYDSSSLAFDKEKMDEDIQRYGLLGYDSFEKYFPKEIYDLLPCKYLGVSIGKGLITWKTFEEYVNKWKDQLMENIK